MQRWEYASLDIVVTNPGGLFQVTSARLILFQYPKAKVIHIQPDKSQGDKNVAEAAFRILAQMGLDGWEMVGAQGEHILYFKRPIP